MNRLTLFIHYYYLFMFLFKLCIILSSEYCFILGAASFQLLCFDSICSGQSFTLAVFCCISHRRDFVTIFTLVSSLLATTSALIMTVEVTEPALSYVFFASYCQCTIFLPLLWVKPSTRQNLKVK